MFNFIRVRFESATLARRLRQSLAVDPASWKIERGDDGATISDGEFKLSLSIRRLRILDSIHVECDGADIWLPLGARIRLRNAVRLFLARHGNLRLQAHDKHPRQRRAAVARAGK